MRTPSFALTVALSALVAVGAQADTKVGVTAAVNPQAIGQPPTEPERVLLVGADNFANEKISTGPAGQVQLLFVDGTSLSVGPDANVTIDEYVYNPNTKTGKLAISASQGLMKLVGGAISKSSEITITTPTMTAGIRGGIAAINARPNQPAVAQFLFGNSMRVTAGGQTQTATRPGFQITVPPGSPPQPPARMTSADVQAASGQLQARSRQTQGGASGNAEAREDSALSQSGVSSSTGSSQAPSSLSQTGTLTTLNQPFNPNTNTAILQAAGAPTTQIDRGAANVQATTFAPTSGVQGSQLFGRFYSDQVFSAFDFSTGRATLNGNNNGAITFTITGTGNNRTITFTLPIGGGLTQQFSLPFVLGTDYSTGTITLNGGRGTINGTVNVAADGQFFVVFGSYTPGSGFNCGNNQGNCKFGLFGGIPTPTLPQSGYSTYNMQTFGNTYPFLGRDNLPLGTSSPLYVAWSPVTNPGLAASTGERAMFMQAGIFISGTAGNQRSGMGGVTGAFFKEANSTVGAAGGMLWMVRDSAGAVSTRLNSGVASAQINVGSLLGNAIYGTDAKYIVFVPDQITPAPGQEDTRATGGVNEVPYNNPQQFANDPGFFLSVGRSGGVVSSTSAGRNTQQYFGYVGGILDSRNSSNTFLANAFGTSFGSGPTTVLSTNAGANKLAANFPFTNFDASGVSYNLVFGNPSNSLGARGAFINDLIFAAREAIDTNGNPTSTFTNTSAGTSGTTAFTRLFMIPNSVAGVNLSSFGGTINQCSCQFLQWGWWVGEVQAASTPTARFQLATWVAGVLPNTIEIPTSGSVTYNGHMVGNVATGLGAGNNGVTYVAAGNFQANWNFASKSGPFFISGWDRGGPFGASGLTLAFTATSGNGRDFSVVTNSTATPSISPLTNFALGGSFFRSPADVIAYMGGNFHMIGTNYKAAGIFVGQR